MASRIMLLAGAVVVAAVSACGDGNSSKVSTPPPSGNGAEVVILDLGTVDLTPANQDQTFDVGVSNATSLVLVADGGNATDIDIDQIVAPNGATLVTPDPGDTNPLTGSVSPQEVGGSVATAIIPSVTASFTQGDYTFSVGSFNAAGTRVAATVRLTAIVNHRIPSAPGVLPVRVFFVGTPGLNAGNAATSIAFQKIVQQMRLAFGAAGIDLQLVDFVDIDGQIGTELAVLDVLDATTDRIVPDVNLNRQSDEMDRLFALSGGRGDRVINVFFVREFFTQSGVVAVSGGAPGPSIISGTAHSGIAASTLDGLDQQSDADLEHLGHDLEVEIARYLGALGTIDPDDFTAAQQTQMLRNPAVVSPTP